MSIFKDKTKVVKNGIISVPDIVTVLTDVRHYSYFLCLSRSPMLQSGYPPELHEALIAVLEKFDVAFSLPLPPGISFLSLGTATRDSAREGSPSVFLTTVQRKRPS